MAHIEEIPERYRRVFVCAHDIAPEWHIRQQAAFQRHCDASISKTINFTHDARPEQVDAIYRMAYATACKGVTVYRDGCRESQPMELDNKDKLKKGAVVADRGRPRRRRRRLSRPGRPSSDWPTSSRCRCRRS